MCLRRKNSMNVYEREREWKSFKSFPIKIPSYHSSPLSFSTCFFIDVAFLIIIVVVCRFYQSLKSINYEEDVHVLMWVGIWKTGIKKPFQLFSLRFCYHKKLNFLLFIYFFLRLLFNEEKQGNVSVYSRDEHWQPCKKDVYVVEKSKKSLITFRIFFVTSLKYFWRLILTDWNLRQFFFLFHLILYFFFFFFSSSFILIFSSSLFFSFWYFCAKLASFEC